MKHSSSRAVFNYWNVRRGHRSAPERSDIEPGPIRRELGDTFILGQDPGGAYRFRLAGTRTCALFCRELKGTDFLILWDASERRLMQERLTAVVEDAAGFVAGVSARNREGAETEAELLLLPLRHRDRTQIRLLGVLAPLVPPYWLGATPVEAMTCGTIRHLGSPAFRVPAPRLVPGTDNARLRRGLVVVDGGRGK